MLVLTVAGEASTTGLAATLNTGVTAGDNAHICGCWPTDPPPPATVTAAVAVAGELIIQNPPAGIIILVFPTAHTGTSPWGMAG